MSPDLENCKAILEKENLTCVAQSGERILKADARGIKPLLSWIQNGEDLQGGAVADKVVGKAAAFLMEKAGFAAVYAAVLSEPAAEVFRRAEIAFSYGKLVPRIQNRTGDGLCPMESAVMEVSDAESAYTRLQEQLRKLTAQMQNGKA